MNRNTKTSKKKRYIQVLCFTFIFILFTGAGTPSFAAADKELTYDYYFEADGPENLNYKVEEEIVRDGKHYRLKDISYDIYSEPIQEKKKIKSKDKTADEYIVQNIMGVDFKLYAPDKIKWKDNEITYTQEYASEEEVPAEIEHEGKKLSLKSMDEVSRVDNVSTTAYFYSDTLDTEEYEFNGKTVYLSGGDPKWDGWKDDYASYLGVQNSNIYTITGTAWNGAARKQSNGIYVRRANVYGTKLVNFVTATYGLSDDSERYTATITYTSKYIAHAKVTYEKYITMRQKIIYAAVGIGALALMTALILFILARRRNKEA